MIDRHGFRIGEIDSGFDHSAENCLREGLVDRNLFTGQSGIANAFSAGADADRILRYVLEIENSAVVGTDQRDSIRIEIRNLFAHPSEGAVDLVLQALGRKILPRNDQSGM